MTDLVSYKKNTRSGILFCITVYFNLCFALSCIQTCIIFTNKNIFYFNSEKCFTTSVYLKLPLLTFAYLCSSLPPSYGTVTDGALPYSSVTNNNREGTEDGDSFITTDDKTEDDDAELYDNHPKVGHSS